jgi:hypothetical protein
MKQISIESLRVGLGIRLHKIYFSTILPPENYYNSNLEVFIYRNLWTSKYSNFGYVYTS